MTYRIGKLYTFDAAHQLSSHKGKCANLHGHTYTVEVIVESDVLCPSGSSEGMVLDYGDMDAVIKPIIEEMDHAFLTNNYEPAWFALQHSNAFTQVDKFCFVGKRTTAENLAEWIYLRVAPSLPGKVTIRVSETPKTFAEYTSNEVYGPSSLSCGTLTDAEIEAFQVKWTKLGLELGLDGSISVLHTSPYRHAEWPKIKAEPSSDPPESWGGLT